MEGQAPLSGTDAADFGVLDHHGGEDDDDDDVRDAVSARTLEERAGGYVSGTLNWIEFAMVSFFLSFSSNTLFKKRLKSVVCKVMRVKELFFVFFSSRKKKYWSSFFVLLE